MPDSILSGPEPENDHGYLVRVYDITRELCKQFEKLGQVIDVQAGRIQILEAHQIALSGIVVAVGELAKRVDAVERAGLVLPEVREAVAAHAKRVDAVERAEQSLAQSLAQSLPELRETAAAHTKRLDTLEYWKAATVTKLVMGSVLGGTVLGIVVNVAMTWLTTGRGP